MAKSPYHVHVSAGPVHLRSCTVSHGQGTEQYDSLKYTHLLSMMYTYLLRRCG